MKLSGKSVRLFTDRHLENIGSMFKNLYNDELLTDCTLYCRDGSIKAHKVILAASSPYFRKVFIEHADEHAIFILHGVPFGQLRDLVELIYKGAIDVPSDTLNAVFDLAEDLQVTGLLLEDGSDTRCNGYGRDTRFKGQKRVAVDYTEENESVPAKIVKNASERRSSSSSEKAPSPKKTPENNATNPVPTVVTAITVEDSPTVKEEQDDVVNRSDILDTEELMGHPMDDQSNLSVWARKERKFKCDLCPSSFKRASHLTRHQLVHTGERPFACSQCEKAFSRHDKLKHHIHKAHTLGPLNDSLPHDSLYTIGHVQILTPETTIVESPEPLPSQQQFELNPLSPPQKKGRGRPRKYPIVPPPLVKRPRGRPRLNPIAPQELTKTENYNISNMPYGDLEYLTKPLQENNEEMSMQEQILMEPLVEIKTEPHEKPESDHEEHNSVSFLQNIGLFENTSVAKIGECTISVASNSCSQEK